MKVYAAPIPAPEVDYSDLSAYSRETGMFPVEERWTEQVRTWLREHGYHHRLTGKIVHFPVADGAAQYMIANGTTLIHLPLGDAWHIPDAHARGLRITDLDKGTKS